MEDLNQDFWNSIMEKYPEELKEFYNWKIDQELSHPILFKYRFYEFPPACQIGLFLQYTMEHENKQDWFRTKNHGTVTEQISRWFEIEHRRNSEPAKKHSAYPAFL